MKEIKSIRIEPNHIKSEYVFTLTGATGGTFNINITDKTTSDIAFDDDEITKYFHQVHQWASETKMLRCFDDTDTEIVDFESFADCYKKQWVVQVANYHEDRIGFYFTL